MPKLRYAGTIRGRTLSGVSSDAVTDPAAERPAVVLPEPARKQVVQLAESMVSQLHARLFRDGKGLNVEDLGSTNGTYVNSRKVSGPTRLKKGDRLRVGPIELEVLG